MKKRILSFVLAAMMVVMVFAIPTTVAGAVSNNYSYKFADTDIRNYVDGQVFDVAAKGESEKAPRMDGVISEGEYAVSGFITRNTANANAPESVPISFAVRNGYIYVAFKFEGEKKQSRLQMEFGVLQDHRSEGAWCRKQVTWDSNDTLINNEYLLKVPGTNTWTAGKNALDSSLFLVDKCHNSDGTYEAKFDIGAFYEVFENSARGEDIYKTPIMTFAFFYDVNNASGVGQTHYAFPIASGAKIDSEVSVGWAPATIIIPEKTLKSVARKHTGIGELGTDMRNMVEGQLVSLEDYTDVSPVLDGVVSTDEYTVTNHEHKTSTGNVTASYAMAEDGYLYVAFTYAESAHSKLIVQPGIGNDNGASNISRTGVTLHPNGTVAYQNFLIKDAANPDNWADIPASTYKALIAVESCATTHNAGMTTYEMKINIATLVTAYSLGGWDADYANAVHFLLFIGGSTQLKYNLTSAQITTVRQRTGVKYNAGYVQPTVELPEGATTKFHYHSSKNVTMIKTPTHYADGLCEYVCDSCGFKVENEIVPRTLDHEFAKPEVHNADFHKIVCPCGFAYYEDHNWDKGELVKGTIADGRDKMLYTCVDCGEEKEEIVPSAATKTEPVATTTPAPTTEAPTTVAPTTEAPTTVAPTTEAPTTVAPTTAAPTTKAPEVTTEAPKSNGCGSVVTLSALALVPMLGAAVVFGKKRED